MQPNFVRDFVRTWGIAVRNRTDSGSKTLKLSELGPFLSLGQFLAYRYHTKTNQLFTAMKAILFTQKNVCAALGLLMALTIVWKAQTETSLAQQTARFEYTKPTSTSIGEAKGSEMIQISEDEINRSDSELTPII